MSLLITQRWDVNWDPEYGATPCTISGVRDGGALYCILDDVVAALGVRSHRRATTDQTLNDSGADWTWLRIDGVYQRVIQRPHLTNL